MDAVVTETVLVSYPHEHVAVVTLNRGEVANAVDRAMTEALAGAVFAVESDPTIRAVVLTGSGDRAFCAGADLKVIAAGGRDGLYTVGGGFAGFVDAPRQLPWIAAVQAAALGGGLEIMLACDIVVAAENARFALPEVKRGMVAAAGGLFRLPQRLPPGLALEMIATGDPIDAPTAVRHGLVDHVVPGDRAIDTALALAIRIAASAPVAVRESLAVARAAIAGDRAALQARSAEAARRNATTSDFAEGPRAFLEKRAPQWRGR